MRAFIAVNMADDLRRALAEAQERLRASEADVKWVRAEGIHITLKFLGWVDDEREPGIADAAAAAVADAGPFRLSLVGIGGFPSATAPRVVWVGVTQGAREMSELPGWEELLPTQMNLAEVEAAPSDEDIEAALDGEFEEREPFKKESKGKSAKADADASDDADSDIPY